MSASASDSGQVLLGNLKVNRLGFGAMRLTGRGVWGEPKDQEVALAVLRRAVELGVNFIDTADAYGPEVSERLIREALHPYEGIVIATKGGLTRPGPNQWVPDGSPHHLRDALEGSLVRLGIAAIDVYQLHSPDPKVPFETSVRTLMEFQTVGKIKHIGLSNVSLEQIKRATDMCEIVSVQNRYNVVEKQDSDEIVDYCREHHIAFIPYFPIGGNGSSLEKLAPIAKKHHATEHQIALAWLLARSSTMLPIPGTSSIEHLEANTESADIQLDDEELMQLNSI